LKRRRRKDNVSKEIERKKNGTEGGNMVNGHLIWVPVPSFKDEENLTGESGGYGF
jgi:hypothetical protein